MNIVLWEWNVSSLGGRQRTMLAFADCLAEMGHNVTFISNWLTKRNEFKPDNFLDWDLCTSLCSDNFIFLNGMERQLNSRTLPPEMRTADLIIVSYGELGHIQDLVTCPVVAWVIHPDQRRPKCLKHIWTNSLTTADRLRSSPNWADSRPAVVIPPHDYSAFRDAAKGYQGREYDLIVVGTLVKGKGLLSSVRLAEDMGLSLVVVGRVQPHNTTESQRVAFHILDTDRVVYVQDAPRRVVADLMGRSMAYLSMSEAESCSLAIYEAMHAGCHIVGRNVGAIEEQLGSTGCIFDTAIEAQLGVKAALAARAINRTGRSRALLFDRSTVALGLEKAVIDVTG